MVLAKAKQRQTTWKPIDTLVLKGVRLPKVLRVLGFKHHMKALNFGFSHTESHNKINLKQKKKAKPKRENKQRIPKKEEINKT